MSTNFAYPPKRRFPPPDESALRPAAVGPDIAPTPVAQPWVDMGGHGGGGMDVGGLVSGLMKMRSPDLKPQPGGNPLGAVPQKGGHKFLGLFRQGGTLRRVGEEAIVGDDGPELLEMTGRGARVTPLPDSSGFNLRDLAAQGGTLAAADDPQLPPQVAALTAAAQGQNRPVNAGDNQLLAAAPSPAPTTPLFTRPPSEFQSNSVPTTGHPKARNMLAPGEEEENDARVRAVIENAGGFAEMGGSEQRPKFADPTGRLQNQIQFEKDNPAHAEQGRSFWRKLRDVGGGALIGMGSAPQGSSLGERLGYGLGMGGVQAVNPDMLSQFRQKQRVEKWGGQLAAAQAQDEARLERAGKIAAVDKTLAETGRLRNPPPDYERVETPDGYVYVDKKNPSGAAVQTGLKAPAKPGARPQTVRLKNEDGSEKVVERGADGVWRDTGLRSAGQPRRRITVGGETFELPEAEAARVLAQIESANITSGNQYGNQAYEDLVRQIDRDNQSAKERYVAARQAVGELREAVKAAQAAVARVNNPHGIWDARSKQFYDPDPNDVARFREEADAAQQRVRGLAADLGPYRDLVDDDPTTGWPTVLKSEPAPKTYPERQAPAKRTGGAVPKPDAPVSENDYVAHAKANWDAQKYGEFDEQKARAAYRKRYER